MRIASIGKVDEMHNVAREIDGPSRGTGNCSGSSMLRYKSGILMKRR